MQELTFFAVGDDSAHGCERYVGFGRVSCGQGLIAVGRIVFAFCSGFVWVVSDVGLPQ